MIEKLQHQLHGANRHRFGSKSEGMDQLQLFAENEEIAEAAVKAAETAPAEPIELKEKPRRKPLPDHLERIEQVLSVGEDCPECGGDLSKLGEDITEELESRKIQMEFPDLRKRYWGRRFWARGYFSTTSGNVTDDVILQYLELHSKRKPTGISR